MAKPSGIGPAGDVTALLQAWSAGDADAMGRLVQILYAELKQVARHYMAHERRGHTLQPTALVNEAFLRLFKAQGVEWHGRAHFLALSARMMRRILISHAVARQSGRREGVANTIPLDVAEIASSGSDVAILELNRALEELARFDLRKAQMVELHFFGGLTFEETAAVLKLSERTIRRDWVFVKTWLAREMGQGTGECRRDGDPIR
jgi:RNA polymerase sigma factor (TIGR02999 family)